MRENMAPAYQAARPARRLDRANHRLDGRFPGTGRDPRVRIQMLTLLLLGCARSHPVAELPVADVLPGAEVRWFALEGADRIELLESCLKDCPRDEQGVAVASLSTWQVRWSWTRGSGEPCEVASAHVHATVVVDLPRWEPPEGAAPALVAEWDAWHSALRGHEQGMWTSCVASRPARRRALLTLGVPASRRPART